MLAGWEHKPRTGSGSFTGGGHKLLLHTTEGGTADGAIAALDRNRSWSHFLISFEEKRKIQFLETNVAAKSLSNNTADGYQTNRANVVQIEIVGYSRDTANWSKEKLDWIAERIKEIRQVFDFPIVTTNKDRMGDKQFVDYAGLCEHRNAPDNDHWDCGDLDVNYIASKLAGTPAPDTGGVLVNTFYAYNSTMSTDKSGNGYADVVHNRGSDPKIVVAQINGNDPKTQGYPQIGSPALLSASYSGSFVRVTCVGGLPNTSSGFTVLAGW